MIRPLIPILALTIAATTLDAQSVRPGSSTRNTNTSNAGNNTRRNGIGGGTNNGSGTSSNGQRQYRSNTELGDATIQIDPETRSLVIVTDEATHDELDRVIKQLDRPKPQVLIKVVFLEVTYNKDSDIGVEASYTYKVHNGNAATTNNSTQTTTQNVAVQNGTQQTVSTATSAASTAAGVAKTLGAQNLFGLASQTTGTFFKLASDDWAATLRLASTKGKVEVLSRPSIMARNNQEAVIVVGQEVPFITNSQVTSTGQTINTIQYDNVGIILRVTPFITSENSVEMIVAPEISSLTDQSVPISSTASSPVISKRSAETVVVTPNAKTVVIGGLMETQHISSVQKIPYLGDIPYLGFPFRRTVKSDVKKELLIFLTPYIVQNPGNLQKVAGHEVSNAELAKQAFPETELDKMLDVPNLFPEHAATTTTTTGATTRKRSSAPAPRKSKSEIQSKSPEQKTPGT